MAARDLELTILMPCLNEARTLGICIRKAQQFLRRTGITGEVLIADNGSTDGSQQLATELGARVVNVATRGYGAALLSGIQQSAGRFVIMGDSDDSYDFSRLDDFVASLRSGADLVVGNRFRGGIEPGAMPPLHRYLGNPVLSFLGRLFFRIPVRDFHCGLRGCSRDAMLRLGLVTPGMEFASEMIAKAALAGLRIEEVPTTLRPDGRDRPPHLRTWRDGWRHLRFLLLFCPRWLFLYPGAVLLSAGMLGFALLLHGPVRILSVGLDVHSLLYAAAATVLGLQLVLMALLTRWMGSVAGIVPPSRWLQRLTRWVTLELGLAVGGTISLGGLVWSTILLLGWSSSGFGPLDPTSAMRSAIPAVTLMITGGQLVVAALFASAMDAIWAATSMPEV